MASFIQLPSGNWRVQIRRKNRYVSETFRHRKDGEEWARPTRDELDELIEYFETNPRQVIPMARIVRYAVATTMRQEEICRGLVSRRYEDAGSHDHRSKGSKKESRQ